MQQLEPVRPNKRSSAMIIGVMVISSAVMLAGIGLIMWLSFTQGNTARIGQIFCGLIPLTMVLIISGLIAVPLAENYLVSWKLLKPGAQVPDPLYVGSALRFTYDQRVNGPSNVEKIEVKLILREWVRWRAGTDTRTESHDYVLAEESRPGRLYQPGSSIHEEFQLRIPADSMHTFLGERKPLPDEQQRKAEEALRNARSPLIRSALKQINEKAALAESDNTLRWYISTRVYVRGWLDSHNEWEITVLPPPPHRPT